MTRALSGYAGGAGAVAAVCAALCCAGLPIIVSVLAATGLSFLRTDAILLPVIVVAASVALWGFWKGRTVHRSWAPLTLAVLGSLGLVLGVVGLHGVVAKSVIGLGAVALLMSTVWNANLLGKCGDTPVDLTRKSGREFQ